MSELEAEILNLERSSSLHDKAVDAGMKELSSQNVALRWNCVVMQRRVVALEAEVATLRQENARLRAADGSGAEARSPAVAAEQQLRLEAEQATAADNALADEVETEIGSVRAEIASLREELEGASPASPAPEPELSPQLTEAAARAAEVAEAYDWLQGHGITSSEDIRYIESRFSAADGVRFDRKHLQGVGIDEVKQTLADRGAGGGAVSPAEPQGAAGRAPQPGGTTASDGVEFVFTVSTRAVVAGGDSTTEEEQDTGQQEEEAQPPRPRLPLSQPPPSRPPASHPPRPHDATAADDDDDGVAALQARLDRLDQLGRRSIRPQPEPEPEPGEGRGKGRGLEPEPGSVSGRRERTVASVVQMSFKAEGLVREWLRRQLQRDAALSKQLERWKRIATSRTTPEEAGVFFARRVSRSGASETAAASTLNAAADLVGGLCEVLGAAEAAPLHAQLTALESQLEPEPEPLSDCDW